MNRLFIGSIFALLFFPGCKKNNDCGCDAEVKYYLPRTAGELTFNQYKSKWMLSYSPGRGAFANYFPCNTNQDSLQAILQGANQSQTFIVWFSGHAKSPCPGEDFGNNNTMTSFEYMNVETVSRN